MKVSCINKTELCIIFKDTISDNDNDSKYLVTNRKCSVYNGVLEKEDDSKKIDYCIDSPLNLRENNIKILLDRDIIGAIKRDHLSTLIKLLKESNRDNNNINISIDYNYEKNTLLHEAIFWNSTNCILYLMKQCSKMIHKQNKDGNTVLHIACLKGNSFLVNELYNLGSNLSIRNNNKETVFHCAIKSGNFELVNNLFNIINNFESLNCLDIEGRNPLHIAVICKNKNLDIITFLIKNGSDIVNVDESGHSIMSNLNKLKKNALNLQIKTILTKSFYDIYKKDSKLPKGSNCTNNIVYDKLYSIIKPSHGKCSNNTDLYKYKLCLNPEYAPYDIKTKDNEYTIDIDMYNVEYNKTDTNVLTEPNPLPKKVLPIKFKQDFEDFQNYSTNNNRNNNNGKGLEINIKPPSQFLNMFVLVNIVLFLVLFILFYE